MSTLSQTTQIPAEPTPVQPSPSSARVRFRCKSLRIDEKILAVKKLLLETQGVLEVAFNKRIGSVLVIFDKTATSAEQIVQKITKSLNIDLEKIQESLKNTHKSFFSKRARTLVKRTMMTAGAASIFALFYSGGKHIFYGRIWLTAMMLHAYQNKRTILK